MQIQRLLRPQTGSGLQQIVKVDLSELAAAEPVMHAGCELGCSEWLRAVKGEDQAIQAQ